MADNTVTLVLNGDVPLAEFAKAIASFNELIAALSVETGGSSLDWIIQDLQVSSAMTTAVGIGLAENVERVINGYAEVGAALENNTPMPFSDRVGSPARKIVSIQDKRVPSVAFDTASRTSLIPTTLYRGQLAAYPAPVAPKFSLSKSNPAYGAIEGRIQTLSNRGNLRFTLYDLLNDKAVSCYFAEGKQETIRGLWGKLAVVEGLITRDPLTGRPISVRQVENITLMPEPCGPYDYQGARGIAPSLSGISPEEAIRRLRDAQ